MSRAPSSTELVGLWSAVRDRVVEEHQRLNDLDRIAGDGDHGENLQRGFKAVVRVLEEAPPSDLAANLIVVGNTLITDVAGSAGFLLGSAFVRAGKAIADAGEVDAGSIVLALSAARDVILLRGKAALGDKTMLDALIPAVDAAAAVAADGSIRTVLSEAAVAAELGAQNTTRLVARKGRASYVGERGLGSADPGATSLSLILRAVSDWAAALEES